MMHKRSELDSDIQLVAVASGFTPLISLRLVTSAGYLICPNDWEQCATESAISKGYFSVSLFYLLLAHLLHASSE